MKNVIFGVALILTTMDEEEFSLPIKFNTVKKYYA